MRVLLILFLFLVPLNWREAIYLGIGATFEASAILARKICFVSPKELTLFSRLCTSIAMHASQAAFRGREPTPLRTWTENHAALSKIPVSSLEDLRLIRFLQERWLAKIAGFSPIAADWVYPCFGIDTQINVNSNHSYSRLIAHNLPKAYQNRMDAWKQKHLILTRPADIEDYLPSSIRIEKIYQEGIGGIQIVAQEGQSAEDLEKQYRFLLDWVSCFGLAANRVELDRWPVSEIQPIREGDSRVPSKEAFLSFLETFEQKGIIVNGAVAILKGLLADTQRWEAVLHSPTLSSIVQLSFSRIEQQLNTTPDLEQIFADLSALIEVLGTFDSKDFAQIYREKLAIPKKLKAMTSYGIHTSGMTSFAGILKNIGAAPRILYGENTYYECVDAIQKAASFSSRVDQASEEEWKKADLLVAQFNPALRPELGLSQYPVEKIADYLHRCLEGREKVLTLALDCTLDRIDSPKVTQLLEEFQNEIHEGILNIICIRSGNKFDLFGMDNYCGAPFFMIHHPKWSHFQSMLVDPVLQCDRLSLNWFCLAYRHALPQLKLYQKQIFENTRALLNRVPEALLKRGTHQIIPFAEEIDPSFIDMKISGRFHSFKASLVSGLLLLKSLEGGHPIFTRPSLGFYHPNFIVIFDKDHSTIRLTLGLDPAQVDLFAECFEIINKVTL